MIQPVSDNEKYRPKKLKDVKEIKVGKVKVGGNNPISVQSMTNTLTTDIKATIKQINEIHSEGADIVRVSCPDESSSKALKEFFYGDNLPAYAHVGIDNFGSQKAFERAGFSPEDSVRIDEDGWENKKWNKT